MNTPNNRRSQDSVERIVRTVFALMIGSRKPLSRITVRDVCEGAGIHRSTFYAHFRDIYDVAEKVEQHMSRELAESFLRQLDEGAHAGACFESLFAFIAEHREFYQLYLNETGGSGVIGLATELFRERQEKIDYRELDFPPEERAYHESFFLYGITAMLRLWVNGGCRETPRELAEILMRQNAAQKWMTGW